MTDIYAFPIQDPNDTITESSFDNAIVNGTFQDAVNNTPSVYGIEYDGSNVPHFVVQTGADEDSTLSYDHGGAIIGPVPDIKW